MKKLILFTFLGGIIALTSCFEGPPGPRGLQGNDGPQGEAGAEGFVFEWEQVDYTANADIANPKELEAFLTYPGDFEMLNSDVALVYLLWDVENINGEDVEIWRPLTQLVGTQHGSINYSFDFTKYDVRLFLTPNYDLGLLESVDTDQWIVRVVIVPGGFWDTGRVDVPEYHSLIEELGISSEPIITSTIRQRR